MDATDRKRSKRRKFVREIGSIVIGVLIALGLGAIATEIGWRLDVRSARGNIADELGEAVGQAQTRIYTSACTEQRMDDIAAIIDEGERTGRLRPVGQFGGPPWFTWDSTVWQSVISAGTAPHLSIEQQSGYGGAYGFIAHLDQANNQELRDWAPLFVIVGPGRAIGSDEIARLRTSLAQARQTTRQIGLLSVRLLQVIKVWELPWDHALGLDRDEVLKGSTLCRPIRTWTNERYGSGNWSGVVHRAFENPITRDRR